MAVTPYCIYIGLLKGWIFQRLVLRLPLRTVPPGPTKKSCLVAQPDCGRITSQSETNHLADRRSIERGAPEHSREEMAQMA
jgi:hypothetical protein